MCYIKKSSRANALNLRLYYQTAIFLSFISFPVNLGFVYVTHVNESIHRF